MRKVVSADPTLADRLTVEVDPSAEPADWDDALAKFLLSFVRKQATRRGPAPLPKKENAPQWLPGRMRGK